MKWTVRRVVQATKGKLIHGSLDAPVRGFSTDSRTLCPGELFIPLKGPRYDGHDFVEEAVAKGACGALVSFDGAGKLPSGVTGLSGKGVADRAEPVIIHVADTLQALQRLATFVRLALSVPVVAVTGSVGKTTVREMLASIFAERYRVLKNPGNLNNQIGVPLTLLRLNEGHEVVVLEMGMNRLGEIRTLCRVAWPNMGVITSVGPAHLEFLGGLEQVVQAKRELAEELPEGAPLILNADDPLVLQVAEGLERCCVLYGVERSAEVRCTRLRINPTGTMSFVLHLRCEAVEVELSLVGSHNVSNALAAAAAAYTAGLTLEEIRRGLEAYRGLPMRMEVSRLPAGFNLLNDAYNANPVSMRAALKTTLEVAGEGRIHLVLGDMLELGGDARRLHREVGALVADIPDSYLYTVGKLATEIAGSAVQHGMSAGRVWTCSSHEEAAERLNKEVEPGDWVLLKGSRGMEMERVLMNLQKMRQP